MTTLQQHNLSERSISIIMKSWRDATSKQYSTYLYKWEIFALQNNVNVWNPDISHILEFFVTLLDQGCGYSAINTARSALSTIIFINNMPVGKHSLVIIFLRGVFNIKPSLPRYVNTWDVNIVLNFLKNMNSFDVISLSDFDCFVYWSKMSNFERVEVIGYEYHKWNCLLSCI